VRVGATQTSKGGGLVVKLKVMHVRRPLTPVMSGLNHAGREFAAAEVRACITANSGAPISFSWGPWSLTTANGIVVEELTSWSDDWWRVPLYPNDPTGEHPIPTGRCVQGWIPFEVPKGSKIRSVDYSPDGSDGLEWRV
jgi:hypothetical protein